MASLTHLISVLLHHSFCVFENWPFHTGIAQIAFDPPSLLSVKRAPWGTFFGPYFFLSDGRQGIRNECKRSAFFQSVMIDLLKWLLCINIANGTTYPRVEFCLPKKLREGWRHQFVWIFRRKGVLAWNNGPVKLKFCNWESDSSKFNVVFAE